MNFFQKQKHKMEKTRQKKEEAKKQKKELELKQKKKTLIVCGITLAVCFIILGIMSIQENGAETSPASVVTSPEVQAETSAPITETTKPEITPTPSATAAPMQQPQYISLSDIPTYSGTPYIAVNRNQPYFSSADYSTVSFEQYSSLDGLGRCGFAYASIGKDIMPTEERGSIGQVKPSGWQTVKYDCVDGKYLYNRCHLIGYQLSAENANTKNLITGTRYLNVEGMLPFENMVADYVKETNNHVLYRITPIFDGNNLVATGVLMEALSVEDEGDGICFNVFCYNVQPGVTIDYATGDNALDGATNTPISEQATPEIEAAAPNPTSPSGASYMLNTNTYKFHYPACSSVTQMKDSNKQEYTGSREDLIAQGYSSCGRCNP